MPELPIDQRIEELSQRAMDDRAAFEPPPDPPDREQAMSYLREGVAPTVAVYLEARTGDWVRFDPAEFDQLERAMNAWLECYAGCYGIELTAEFTLRTAAEVLLDTHDIQAVARVLTKVPGRERTVSHRQ